MCLQGAGTLQTMVVNAAKKLGGKVVSGPAYDVTTNTKSPTSATDSYLRRMPLPCCLGFGGKVEDPILELFSDNTASHKKMSRVARLSKERTDGLRSEMKQQQAAEVPRSIAEELAVEVLD